MPTYLIMLFLIIFFLHKNDSYYTSFSTLGASSGMQGSAILRAAE